MKPTRFLISHALFQGLARRCQGGHRHQLLKGRVWSDFFNAFVFRTKLAQVYPLKLCSQFASILQQVWPALGAQLQCQFSAVFKIAQAAGWSAFTLA